MKGGLITNYERMLAEYKRLEQQIKLIQNQINRLPEGKLICSRTENRYKWFHSDSHVKTYIPKSNRKFAEKLAQKKYLTLQLEELESEKRAIQFYLRHHRDTDKKSERLLIESSEYQNLLSPYFKPASQELTEWMESPYEHNPAYPEQLVHNGCTGTMLRSKSEVLIELQLHTNQIPYRYEAKLILKDSIMYPDFTIRHPETGKIYYWEHFGMMDNPAYIKKTCEKIEKYALSGIIPSVNLITTYETKEHPLTSCTIKKIVEQYF